MTAVCEAVTEAIDFYSQVAEVTLNGEEKDQISKCVSFWTESKRNDGCCSKISRVLELIWEALKSIFGQSQWQQTSKLMNRYLMEGSLKEKEHRVDLAKRITEGFLKEMIKLNQEQAGRLVVHSGAINTILWTGRVSLYSNPVDAGNDPGTCKMQ